MVWIKLTQMDYENYPIALSGRSVVERKIFFGTWKYENEIEEGKRG